MTPTSPIIILFNGDTYEFHEQPNPSLPIVYRYRRNQNIKGVVVPWWNLDEDLQSAYMRKRYRLRNHQLD